MSSSVYRVFTIGWGAYDEIVRALRDGEGKCISETINFGERHFVYQHWTCACFCYMVQDENPFYACPCCNGTCGMQQHLRIARFVLEDTHLVAEEYLKMVIRGECGPHIEIIDTVVYQEGQRPHLETKEIRVDIPLTLEEREELDRFLALNTWEECQSFQWVYYKRD